MADVVPICSTHDHPQRGAAQVPSPQSLSRAARLLKALGDEPRLRLLLLLASGERCVSELVTPGDKFSTVSQRLRILRTEGLVIRRREGTHLLYTLADRHVSDLIENALAHAEELETPRISV